MTVKLSAIAGSWRSWVAVVRLFPAIADWRISLLCGAALSRPSTGRELASAFAGEIDPALALRVYR